MPIDLPKRATDDLAVRVWQATPEEVGRVGECTWFERMFGDDDMMRHPPIDPDDMWWVAYPSRTPMDPRKIGGVSPDRGELVCDTCLPQVIYTRQTGWDEANE